MSTFIIITSIFAPTEAVKKHGQNKKHKLIVVGDKKSPTTYNCEGALFYDVSRQEQLPYQMVKLLPFNHYGRKMLGYLEAIKAGAEVIIDTDDDNLPYENWGFPAFEGNCDTSPENRGFVNMYKNFTKQHVWPRGFPLPLVLNPDAQLKEEEISVEFSKVGIWQGLADEDPDVDAIYRLTVNTPVFFEKRTPIVLKEGTLCPFNSQNTAFRKELFPLLYLPAYVTFRFTDILRGLVAQPIMWQAGYRLGFTGATVLQERNPHNYLKDFESEIPCFLSVEDVIETVSKVVSKNNSIAGNLMNAYEALHNKNIVTQNELILLDAWLKDVTRFE